MIAIASGFIAGIIHVVFGVDHIASLIPFSLEQKSGAWKIGLRWGIGHSVSVAVLGMATYYAGQIIPINALSSWSEILVGFVLIAVGIWGIRKAFSKKVHVHIHTHDSINHTHFHVHKESRHKLGQQTHRHSHSALGIGVLHGLAGSSHLLSILPALALPTKWLVALYLGFYLVGTIVAMISISWIIGTFSLKYTSQKTTTYRYIMSICSFAAVCIGCVWLI